MDMGKRCAAEFIGTFWLVFGGCGSAVLAAAFPDVGIGLLGVAFAFGLTVLTMAYAIGHISGCHLNPAVSVGLVAGDRFKPGELLPYVIAQVVGGIAGAAVLYVIASGKVGFTLADGFASNGYGAHSPGGYSLLAGFVAEFVLTFMFLLIILGATDKRAPAGLCSDCHWLGADADPFDRDPGHEPVGESGAFNRTCDLRWRLGDGTIVAVLDCSHSWRGRRGCCVSTGFRIASEEWQLAAGCPVRGMLTSDFVPITRGALPGFCAR